mgnify:CR=1 FL=1|tara:strand:+ start:516 stop:890 length:375 start_codon:yes stop_codon:yes gene_type:complete
MPRSADEEPLRQVIGKKGDSFWLGMLFSSACGLPLSFEVFLRARENFCFDIPIGEPAVCQQDGITGLPILLWLGVFCTMITYGLLSAHRGERHYGIGLVYGAVFYPLQVVAAMATGSVSALMFG